LSNAADAGFAFTSSEPGSTFECSLDEGAWTTCTSPAEYSDLMDGAHTFAVRAIDPAGNTDPIPAEYGWTVDTVSPSLTILTHPGTPTNHTAASFTFTATDISSGIDTVRCHIDSAPAVDCAAGSFSTSLGEGTHTFYIDAIDHAGHPASANFTWIIDVTPPEAQLSDLAAFQTSLSFPVNWTGTDALSSIANYDVQVQLGGVWTDWQVETLLTSASFTGEDGNEYTFRVRAADKAGNVGDWGLTATTIVDITNPVATMDPLPTYSEPDFIVRWSGIDATSGIAHYEVEVQQDGGGWSTWKGNTTSLSATFNGVKHHHYTFRIRAVDQAGNVGEWSQPVETQVHMHIFLPIVQRP
jgi:hypothetical protein